MGESRSRNLENGAAGLRPLLGKDNVPGKTAFLGTKHKLGGIAGIAVSRYQR